MSARLNGANINTHRGVRVLGPASIASGVIVGVGVFLWLAGMDVNQTSWLANPRPAAAVARPPATGLVERSDNRGQVLFGRYCDSCHPGGREGIGSDLEGTQVKRQYTTDDKVMKYVRAGGFDMPSFPKTLISDDDLAAIAGYVRELPPAQQVQ